MLALDRVALPQSSQATGSASTARLARHQESATTATASGMRTTRRTPFIAAIATLVDRFQPAAEDRAMHDGGVEHARQPHVDRVDRLPGDLVDAHRDARVGLPASFHSPGFFSRMSAGGVILAASAATAPNVTRALAWLVGDRCSSGDAFRRRDVPARRGGGDQHLPRRGAGLPQRKLRERDRAARPGRQVAPDFAPAQIFLRSHELGAHLRPVAFELLGDQHGEAGHRALAHLGVGNADGDGVVGLDHDPAADLDGCIRSRSRSWVPGKEQAEREPAAHAGGADKKCTAIKFAAGTHGFPHYAPRLAPLRWQISAPAAA